MSRAFLRWTSTDRLLAVVIALALACLIYRTEA
jgi:hypothetical protein